MSSEEILLIQSGFKIIFFALIGGLIPSLIWLWFWLHEDTKHKEPKHIIFFTFTLGMLGAFVALLFQFIFHKYFINIYYIDIHNYKLINLIFVIIEEFIKFTCAYVVFFRTKLFNEPIDAFIYLMTAAIGFASMENSLYLIKPLTEGQTLELIINTHVRFIGANILHVASSGVLALFIGYSFYKKRIIRELYIWVGLIIATLLHWLFNIFLLTSINSVVFVFLATWIVVIFIILSLEKIKNMSYRV